jgi:bifunctional UDP-N-acetylglucosamine pyrophosphorylase/glucosamine-1-phosphate N-acetyltransferase
MKAVILAGGAGHRMFPFDKYWQKAFLPVGNVPNTRRLINMLAGFGVVDVTVLTGSQPQWAANTLRDMPQVTIADAGKEPGSAVLALCGGTGQTLVLYGDIYLTGQDLGRMLAEPAGDAAVLLQSGPASFRRGDWICANTDGGLVRSFWGHPRESYANARSGGVFLLKHTICRYLALAPPVFRNVPPGGMPAAGFTVEQCLQTAMEDGLVVEARHTEGNFVDIDFPWDYLQANIYSCRDDAGALKGLKADSSAVINSASRPRNAVIGKNTFIGDNVLFKGNCIIGDNTVIKNGVVVGENCIIGSDCVIEDYCKISSETVVGSHCRLGFTAEVAGVLMDRVAAVHNCELFGVTGTAVDIGAGTTAAFLRFDDEDVSHRVQGKRYVHALGKAVYIGDYSRTGVNTSFLPGAKIGANCAIGPGVVAGGNVDHGTLLIQKQELEQSAWGPHRYGWQDSQ